MHFTKGIFITQFSPLPPLWPLGRIGDIFPWKLRHSQRPTAMKGLFCMDNEGEGKNVSCMSMRKNGGWNLMRKYDPGEISMLWCCYWTCCHMMVVSPPSRESSAVLALEGNKHLFFSFLSSIVLSVCAHFTGERVKWVQKRERGREIAKRKPLLHTEHHLIRRRREGKNEEEKRT